MFERFHSECMLKLSTTATKVKISTLVAVMILFLAINQQPGHHDAELQLEQHQFVPKACAMSAH